MSDSDYTLYSYFRSSCSARLRIILNAKEISFTTVPINLLKDEQLSDAHRALNPSATVPLLVAHRDADLRIGQSLAAMEYLEEKHPGKTATLPTDARGRAAVRAMAAVIACDTQPVTNLRIMRRVRGLGASAEDWNKDLMADGLRAYEALAKETAGKFSYGDELTIADACLMPAVWNAKRFGVDVAAFPTITKIAENLEAHPAVQKAGYFVQPDTPDDLRK